MTDNLPPAFRLNHLSERFDPSQESYAAGYNAALEATNAASLLRTLREIAERADSNLNDLPTQGGGIFHEDYEDVASGLLRIRDEAQAAINNVEATA